MKKPFLSILAVALAACILCGCQAAPFSEASESPTTEPSGEPGPAPVSRNFTSIDGSLEFSMALEDALLQDAFSAATVEPHYMTGADAQQIAALLLPGAVFYEREKEGTARYSKDEIQRKIDLYSRHAGNFHSNLFHSMDENGREISPQEAIDGALRYWQAQLNSASTENPHVLCDWRLKNRACYYNQEPEPGNTDLMATATVDEVDYFLSLVSINRDNHKISNLCLRLAERGTLEDIFQRSLVCGQEEPAPQQVEALMGMAQDLLNQMKLGTWQAVSSDVRIRYESGSGEYSVVIDACPVLNGCVTESTQTSGQQALYGMPHAAFEFSAEGRLLRFDLINPIDETAEMGAVSLPMDTLMQKVTAYLTASDISADYGAPMNFCQRREKKLGEPLLGKITFSQSQVTMGRTENGDRIVYLPFLCLSGSADYYAVESGQLSFGTGNPFGERIQPLLWVNMVDGSIIRA